MASTFRGNLTLHLDVAETGDDAYSGGPHWSAALDFTKSLANGVGANQFNLAYFAERTVASDADDDIDLSGVLTSALGISFAAAELVMVMIANLPKPVAGVQGANTTALTIGGGSNPQVAFMAADDIIGPIPPGGIFLLGGFTAAGIGAITAGTGDILRVANAAGAQNKYQICVLGRAS